MRPITTSLFSLFKVGPGPSSSHTIGPMTAGRLFSTACAELPRELLARAARIRVRLFGSLSATGAGHGTDAAVLAGLLGVKPEDCPSGYLAKLAEEPLKDHRVEFGVGSALVSLADVVHDAVVHKYPYSNTLVAELLDAGGDVLFEKAYYSVGGGFIVAAREDDPEQPVTPKAFQGVKTKPYPYRTGDELMKIARDNNLTIAELVYRNECVDRTPEEVDRRLDEVWQVMHAAVERGMRQTEVLPGPFRIARRANALMQDVRQRTDDPLAVLDWVNVYAMAVAEDRAGFAIEVLAARGQTAGATLALSDMHKTAGQQLVALANGNFDDSGAQSSSSGQNDPRQKVYAIDQLLANPTAIADKASGQTVPTAAAIEMDCARAQIKAVTESKSSTESDTLLILAALAAKHAYTAFQLGYPATDAALFE